MVGEENHPQFKVLSKVFSTCFLHLQTITKASTESQTTTNETQSALSATNHSPCSSVITDIDLGQEVRKHSILISFQISTSPPDALYN